MPPLDPGTGQPVEEDDSEVPGSEQEELDFPYLLDQEPENAFDSVPPNPLPAEYESPDSAVHAPLEQHETELSDPKPPEPKPSEPTPSGPKLPDPTPPDPTLSDPMPSEPTPPGPKPQDPDTPDPLDHELNEVVTHLKSTELFRNVELASLARLAPLFYRISLDEGQTVAVQDQVDDRLWVVIDGALSVDRWRADGGVESVGSRHYAGVVGRWGVFTSRPRSDTVVTVAPTELLYAYRDDLWKAFAADPEALDRLMLPEDIRARLQPPGGGLTAVSDTLVAVEGEYTLAVFRRHWIVLARRLAWPAGALVAAMGLAVILAPILQSPALIFALAAFGLVAPALAAGWIVWDYSLDRLMVTNHRLIAIEETPFVESRRQETFLASIQDLYIRIPNPAARILGYGTIIAQTSGTRGAIRFGYVPQPDEVRRIVLEQVEKAKQHAHRERQERMAGQLRRALGFDGAPPEAEGEVRGSPDGAPGKPFAGMVSESLGAIFTYFRPRMRLEVGSTVTWRKHWWVLLRSIWLPGLCLAAVAAIGLWWGLMRVGAVGATAIDGGLLLLLALVWLVIFGWVLWRYEDWRNDLYQLTDSHLIDTKRRPLGFFEERRQAPLDKIQDVRYVKPSPAAWLLNYGNVFIETAAELGSFTFDYVLDPAGVQHEILDRVDQHRRQAERQRDQHQADEFVRWLVEYHRVVNPSNGNRDSSP